MKVRAWVRGMPRTQAPVPGTPWSRGRTSTRQTGRDRHTPAPRLRLTIHTLCGRCGQSPRRTAMHNIQTEGSMFSWPWVCRGADIAKVPLRAARLPAVIVRCEADGSLMCCAGLVILCAPVAGPASSWPGHGRAGGGREHYRRGVAPQPSSGAGRPRFAHHAAEMAAFGPGSVLLPLVLAGRRSSRPPVRPSGRLDPGRPRRKPVYHPHHREGVSGHLVEQSLDLIRRPVPGGSAWQAFLMAAQGHLGVGSPTATP